MLLLRSAFALTLLATSLLAAEVKEKVAVVVDKDGFANVRSSPDVRSDVVLKIKTDEFILCEPSDEGWWPVQDFFGNKGFVHSSRLRLLGDLPKSEVERLLVNPPLATTDEFVDIREVNKRELFKTNRNKRTLVPGQLETSGDEEWFYNDKLKQGIFLGRGTDGLLPTMLLFSTENVPDVVITEFSALEPEPRKRAPKETLRKQWDKLIDASVRIPEKHFKTALGLRLGDPVKRAIKLYGEPHHRMRNKDTEIFEWGYAGEYYYGGFFGLFGIDSYHPVSEREKVSDQFVLEEKDWEEIKTILQDGARAGRGALAELFDRTRGPKVGEGGGYRVKLYAKHGKLVAILFERPMI